MIPFGAYGKGVLWKWGARGAGGGVAWMVLLGVGGVWGPAFALFVIGFGIGVLLSLPFARSKGGTPSPATPPAPGLWGLGFRVQDWLGDLVLTAFWRVVGSRTGATPPVAAPAPVQRSTQSSPMSARQPITGPSFQTSGSTPPQGSPQRMRSPLDKTLDKNRSKGQF